MLVKLQPYAQSSVANQPCKKLSYKFFGPFTVVQKVGSVAYKLDLPEDSRVHSVFHVSQLKPFLPNYTPVFSELPKTPDLTSKGLLPIKILDRRMRKKGNEPVVQILQWSTLTPAAAT